LWLSSNGDVIARAEAAITFLASEGARLKKREKQFVARTA
jgi:hypothetical protein